MSEVKRTPTAEQLRNTILQNSASSPENYRTEAQRDFEEDFKSVASHSEFEYIHRIHRTGLKDHYKHKSIWSFGILGLMFAMIAFQSYLLTMVGSAQWSFKDYQWLLPALLAQNLAQVVVLAVIVVKSLFVDIGSMMANSRKS